MRFPLARTRGKPDQGNPKLACGAAHHVRGQKALGTFQELKFHGFSFVESPVAVFLDGGKMHKYVLTGRALNEAIPLGSVEPLDCSLLFHKRNSFRLIFKLESPLPQTSGERLLPCRPEISCSQQNGWFTAQRAADPCALPVKFKLYCKSINPIAPCGMNAGS